MTKSALESFVKNKKTVMLGGGYSVNPNDQIAGMATYNGYDDIEIHNINPRVNGNKLIGGSRKKKRSTKRKKSKKHNKSKKTKKNKKLTGGCGNSMNTLGEYPFHGELSDYTPNKKDYNGKQPKWSPKVR
jgi:hypothetical protein